MTYYFDMETTGFDPSEDKIITIQFQKLHRYTGEPIGDLEILKEWESSEEGILTEFLPNLIEEKWDFIMVGNNLLFEFMFLTHKARKYGLHEFDISHWHDRVSLDIKHILIMINKGNFKGYPKLIRKTGKVTGKEIPGLYNDKRWPDIVKYIQDEAESFIKAFKVLKRVMPPLKEELTGADGQPTTKKATT